MANNPKKMMDPTEAALSAIQEALNLRDEDERPEAQAAEPAASPRSDSDFVREIEPTAPIFDQDFDLDPIGARAGAPAPVAANDDQQSIGQVLRALQRRPARTSYFVAAMFSVSCEGAITSMLDILIFCDTRSAGITL